MKRLRLLSALGMKYATRLSKKRQHLAGEASSCTTKRARSGAISKVKRAGRMQKAVKAWRRDVKLPLETLVCLLRLLDRDDLEVSQLVSRQFGSASRTVFDSGDVPLRKIEEILIWEGKRDGTGGLFSMEAKRAVDRGVCSLRGKADVECLARLMRFSNVELVTLLGNNRDQEVINHWSISSEIWNGIMNAFQGAVIDTLRLSKINFCPLTAAEVECLTVLDVRKSFYMTSCHLLSNHISDAFLLNMSKKCLLTTIINECTPVDKPAFEASDDGALALCFPPAKPLQTELQVIIPPLSFTGDFYLKCAQKYYEAPRAHPKVVFCISPVPEDAERRILELNPFHVFNEKRDIHALFPGAGWVFYVDRSELPHKIACTSMPNESSDE